jgi:hypothetical protein
MQVGYSTTSNWKYSHHIIAVHALEAVYAFEVSVGSVLRSGGNVPLTKSTGTTTTTIKYSLSYAMYLLKVRLNDATLGSQT